MGLQTTSCLSVFIVGVLIVGVVRVYRLGGMLLWFARLINPAVQEVAKDTSSSKWRCTQSNSNKCLGWVEVYHVQGC